MKAIPITKKLCTAGGGYASPAKIAPALVAKLAPMAINAMSGKKESKESNQQPAEQKPEKTAAEKKLFL